MYPSVLEFALSNSTGSACNDNYLNWKFKTAQICSGINWPLQVTNNAFSGIIQPLEKAESNFLSRIIFFVAYTYKVSFHGNYLNKQIDIRFG